MHWSERYIGQPYIRGDQDCAALAERVAREVLGIDVQVPAQRGQGAFARSAQIEREKFDVAERVDEPIDGQPVIMICCGRAQHIGVMCDLGGEWWVLHADEGFGAVIRQRLRDLAPGGIRVEGFYRWLHA